MKFLLACLALSAASCASAHAQGATGGPPSGSSATSDSGAAAKGKPDTSTNLPSSGAATPSPAAPLQSPESKKEGQDATAQPAEPAKK